LLFSFQAFSDEASDLFAPKTTSLGPDLSSKSERQNISTINSYYSVSYYSLVFSSILLALFLSSPQTSLAQSLKARPEKTLKSKVVYVKKKRASSQEEKQELALLEVMNLVKANELSAAVNRLEFLREKYPEHEADYTALLEMARQRLSREGWYRFEAQSEQNGQKTKVYIASPQTFQARKGASRLEDLKRQTWFVLSCRNGQN
jgi:outer membrane PBP1 activator LpoA protein